MYIQLICDFRFKVKILENSKTTSNDTKQEYDESDNPHDKFLDVCSVRKN